MCFGSAWVWERDSKGGTNWSQKTGAEKPKHSLSAAIEMRPSMCVVGLCTILGRGVEEQEVTKEVNEENRCWIWGFGGGDSQSLCTDWVGMRRDRTGMRHLVPVWVGSPGSLYAGTKPLPEDANCFPLQWCTRKTWCGCAIPYLGTPQGGHISWSWQQTIRFSAAR